MRVEEFDEIGVVWTIGNCFVRKELFPASVNFHDDCLAGLIVLTSLDQNMVERGVQCLIIGVFIKDMFFE